MNLLISFVRFLLSFLRPFFLYRLWVAWITPAITAAFILLLLFVVAFGMLQQPFSVRMTLDGDDVSEVFGTPCPQTWTPSDDEGCGVFGTPCPQTWTPSDEEGCGVFGLHDVFIGIMVVKAYNIDYYDG